MAGPWVFVSLTVGSCVLCTANPPPTKENLPSLWNKMPWVLQSSFNWKFILKYAVFFFWHSKVVKKKSSLDACRKFQVLFLILFFLKSTMKTTFLCNVKVLKTVQMKAWAAQDLFSYGICFFLVALVKVKKIFFTIWFSDFSASLL